MAPTDTEIRAAIGELRAEAQLWRTEMLTTVRTAGAAADGFDLREPQLSFASGWTGLVGTYQAAQQKVVTLLGQAATNFESIGAALDTAANGYEADERNAVHRNQGIY